MSVKHTQKYLHWLTSRLNLHRRRLDISVVIQQRTDHKHIVNHSGDVLTRNENYSTTVKMTSSVTVTAVHSTCQMTSVLLIRTICDRSMSVRHLECHCQGPSLQRPHASCQEDDSLQPVNQITCHTRGQLSTTCQSNHLSHTRTALYHLSIKSLL